MPLTNTACTNAKPRAKTYKLSDGQGMYLEVSPGGGKWWRIKYYFAGREKRLSLGVYPEVSLSAARLEREKQRALVREGVDPSEARRLNLTARRDAADDSFEVIAREYLAKWSPTWKVSHSSKVIERFERDLFPWLGARPITALTAPEILGVLRRVEMRGALDTAHRGMQNVSQVFRYAIACGKAASDPTLSLKGALAPATHGHFASVTAPEDIGQLMRKIQVCRGMDVTRAGLQIHPYVWSRPTELRAAPWKEFDLDGAEWRIPGARMKMKHPHIVPLPRQAVAILRDLHKVTGSGKLVFPGAKSGKPISDATLRAALYDLGYSGEVQTIHGFRTMASTNLNELGFRWDAIERQLAHKEKDETRGAYNHAQYLDERRVMMQWWADYIDALRDRTPPPKLPKIARGA